MTMTDEQAVAQIRLLRKVYGELAAGPFNVQGLDYVIAALSERREAPAPAAMDGEATWFKYACGEKVVIRELDAKATVTACRSHMGASSDYQLTYWFEGERRVDWFDAWEIAE